MAKTKRNYNDCRSSGLSDENMPSKGKSNVPKKRKVAKNENDEAFARFNNYVEIVLSLAKDKTGEHKTSKEDNFLERQFLQDLSRDASVTKNMDKMETVSLDKLVLLLNILEYHIRGGNMKLMIPQGPDKKETVQLRKVNLQAVSVAVESSLICLYIMTSKNMPKRVYMEEVIERTIKYTMYQLHNSIFPFFDSSYFPYGRKVYNKSKGAVLQDLLILYVKLVEVMNLLSELVDIQLLTHTLALDVVSMCIASIFVDSVNELEFSASKLLIKIFTKYECVRIVVLDKLLLTISELPNQERGCKIYQLDSGEPIHRLTVVIMELIQSIATFSENIVHLPKNKRKSIEVEKDNILRKIHHNVISTAGMFSEAFLRKCCNDVNNPIYKKLFEHFINDLLATAFKPEWPSADVMLCLMGKLLVDRFSNVNEDQLVRTFALEQLGRMAVKLRKRNLEYRFREDTTEKIVESVVTSSENNNGEETMKNIHEEKKINMLQKVLLDFLAVNSKTNDSYTYALNFYVSQWYRDLPVVCHAPPVPRNGKRNSINIPNKQAREILGGKKLEFLEQRKRFLLNNLINLNDVEHLANRTPVINYQYAAVISEVLASKRYFFNSFEQYLLKILNVIKDDSISIRTKAVKCLTSIIETDPKILENDDVKLAINITFVDRSSAVRETALNLVGKFLEAHPRLLAEYYDAISARILDAGVNVRKSVIKIFRHILLSNPGFEKNVDVFLKIIRRVKDEDGIKKLIVEIFQESWFSPCRDARKLEEKVKIIMAVVKQCGEHDFELLEKLLTGMFNPNQFYNFSTKTPAHSSKDVTRAYEEIFSYIITEVDKLRSKKIVKIVSGLFKTIHLLAKVKPVVLDEHIMASLTACIRIDEVNFDVEDLDYVCQTLETGLSSVQNNLKLMKKLEKECLEICLDHRRSVPEACFSLISKIVNKYTNNYSFIKQCFDVQLSNMLKFKLWLEEDNLVKLNNVENMRKFVRSLLIVGKYFKHFDLTAPPFNDPNMPDKSQAVYEALLYFLEIGPLRKHTLSAIGDLGCRHFNFMLDAQLKCFYKEQLRSDQTNEMRIQILSNIKAYLLEEKNRIVQQELEWQELSKKQCLKEMVDVSSGMASCIMQTYIGEVMQSYPNSSLQVRQLVHNVIQLTLEQGLVQTVGLVPYFMCMATDPDKVISYTADQHLLEVARTYPHFIHTNAAMGLWFSYLLHKMLNGEDQVRGFTLVSGANPIARNGYFYSLIRKTKMYRHSFLLNILKKFDEADISLSYKLYLADNLAYFSYQILEEPLFIFYHIDTIVSLSGTNALQSFLEGLASLREREENSNCKSDENASVNIVAAMDDDKEDIESLLKRMPEDLTDLRNTVKCIQGYLLLPLVKQYLKDAYWLNKSKVQLYCPGQSTQIYEKPIMRKCNIPFEPESILELLKSRTITVNSDEEKRFLIDQYYKFKKLSMEMDDEDLENGTTGISRSLDRNMGSMSNKKRNNQVSALTTPQPIKSNKKANRNSKSNIVSKKVRKTVKRRLDLEEEGHVDSSDPDYSV